MSLAGRGIDTDRSSRIVWALTSLLAGLAGADPFAVIGQIATGAPPNVGTPEVG